MPCPLEGQGINPSWWLTLLFSYMMGWGSLTKPGPDRASFSSHGVAQEVVVLRSSPGLSSPSQWGDAEGPWAFQELLLSAESRRGDMSTPGVWHRWWQIGLLIDIVSAELGKHEDSMSSLQSLVPSHILCIVAALCSQTEGSPLSGISFSSH